MLINPGDLIPVQAEATAIPWSHRRSQILNLLHRGPVCFSTLVYDTNVGDISPVSTYFNPERISVAELNTRFGHCPSSGLVAPLNTAESRGGVQPRLLLYPKHNQANLNILSEANNLQLHVKRVANRNLNDNHNQVANHNNPNQVTHNQVSNHNHNQVANHNQVVNHNNPNQVANHNQVVNHNQVANNHNQLVNHNQVANNHNQVVNHNQVANNARNQMKQFPEHNLSRHQITKQRTLKWVLAQEAAGNAHQQQPIGHHLGNRQTEFSDVPTTLAKIHSNYPSTLSIPPSRLAYISSNFRGQPSNPVKTTPSTTESALDNIWNSVEKNSLQDRPTSSFGRPASSLDTVSNMDLASSSIDRVPSSLEIGSSNLDRGSSSSYEDLLPTENFAWLEEFCSTEELKLDVDKRWAAWDSSAQDSKLTAW